MEIPFTAQSKAERSGGNWDLPWVCRGCRTFSAFVGARGWTRAECNPYAAGILVYHHHQALCQPLNRNTGTQSSLFLHTPWKWNLTDKEFPMEHLLQEVSSLSKTLLPVVWFRVFGGECTKFRDLCIVFLGICLHRNIAVPSTAMKCTLWKK